MFGMSVPKILLMDDVRFYVAGFDPPLFPTPVVIEAFAEELNPRTPPALSPLSVTLLKEFRLMTITFEFSLFPFLIN